MAGATWRGGTTSKIYDSQHGGVHLMSCTACSAWPLEPDNSQARQCELALMPCMYANLGPVIMSSAGCRTKHVTWLKQDI